MVVKTFRVVKYKLRLGYKGGATWNGVAIRCRGYICCYNINYEYRFIIYFLTEDSPVADPVYIEQNKVGAIFLPFKEIMPYIDMVRNERPIYAYLNSDKPEWNCIRTSIEPIGEEDT